MAEKQKCMIIGASPIYDRKIFDEFDPADYFIICADAGYETARSFGIRPDLIVGDFDSAKERPEEGDNCFVLPVEKDVTDTMYAAMMGLKAGFRYFVLLGCLGGERFDHSIANLEVLQYITNHSAIAVLADEKTKAILLKGRRLNITQSKGYIVSVFPYCGQSCNVSYRGLEYPLSHKTLTCGGRLMGVSNSVIEDTAEIIVHTGTALIILYQP